MLDKIKCFLNGHRWVAWYNAGYVCQRCSKSIIEAHQMEPKDRVITRATE